MDIRLAWYLSQNLIVLRGCLPTLSGCWCIVTPTAQQLWSNNNEKRWQKQQHHHHWRQPQQELITRTKRATRPTTKYIAKIDCQHCLTKKIPSTIHHDHCDNHHCRRSTSLTTNFLFLSSNLIESDFVAFFWSQSTNWTIIVIDSFYCEGSKRQVQHDEKPKRKSQQQR